MNGFLSALQFLTILPIGKDLPFDPQKMIPCFPLVGVLIGGLLALFDYTVSGLWPETAVAVLDVLFLIIITGALHVDGVGDTADGLYGFRTKERALEIMKDSRVGAIGVVAMVSCLSVKWAGIVSLSENRFLFLFLIPAYARSANLFGFRFLKYGRREDGTGHAFFEGKPEGNTFLWMLVPVGLSLFLGWHTLLLNSVFLGFTFLILLYYRKKVNCITGDMLGAMIEVLEAFLFLVVSMEL